MALSLQLGLVYLISELLLTVTRRSRSRTGTKQDRSTLGMIWLVIAVSITAGVFVAQNFRAAALLHGRMFAVAGVVLFVAGLLLRWWAIITLGRFFTVDVAIEKDLSWSSEDRSVWCVILPTLACYRRSSVLPYRSATGPRCLSFSYRCCGFHAPDECGGGCACARARSALRRLYEAHQTSCAFRLLTSVTNDHGWHGFKSGTDFAVRLTPAPRP
jgi:hypothetical protein